MDAAEEGAGNREALRRLREPLILAASQLFTPLADPPSLLHGALWSGNVFEVGRSPGGVSKADSARSGDPPGGEPLSEGEPSPSPVLTHPACWYGHAEFDLALPQLEGWGGDAFRDGYHSLRPKKAGFEERQRVYMLYHVLVRLALRGKASLDPAFFRPDVSNPKYHTSCFSNSSLMPLNPPLPPIRTSRASGGSRSTMASPRRRIMTKRARS